MLLRLDPASSASLFDQLADQLRAAILTGSLDAGERLPAARDLAESLGINRNTVLKVYQSLRDEGLVDLRRGRGAVVVAPIRGDERAVVVDEVRALARRAAAIGIGADALCALIRKESL